MPILSVEGLHHWYGGLHVIDDVSFACRQGAIKAIIGPNGAGKTTLFNLIAGNLSPVSGSIRFLGEETAGLKPHRIAEKGVSRTFQASHLFPGMTVLENVMTGCHVASGAGFFSCMFSLPRARREESRIRARATAILEEFDITSLARKDGQSLPFGRQRIVEIARAMAAEPRLLLLDEPACGLTMNETQALGGLIRRIKDRGTTVIIVEHDMSIVMEISDEVVVLNYGRKITEGPPREIQSNPEVISIYLGEEASAEASSGGFLGASKRHPSEPGAADA